MKRTVRTRRSATVGVVAELVNVHATLCQLLALWSCFPVLFHWKVYLSIRVVPADVVRNGRRGRFRRLLKVDGPLDVRVAPDDSN